MSSKDHKIKIRVKKPSPHSAKSPKEPSAAEPVAVREVSKPLEPLTTKVESKPAEKSKTALKFFTQKAASLLGVLSKKRDEIQDKIKGKKETKDKNPPKKKGLGTSSLLYAGFSIKELVHFTKRLAFLVRSGVPIFESLQLLAKQTRSRARGRVLESVVEDVSNGRTLSAGLARFPKIFGDFAINVVRVGELSGTLSSNLTYLSEELEKRNTLKRKVVGALVYPAFITASTIGITTLLTVYIFPKVMPIFISLNVTLPFTTVALLFLSNFLRNYGLYVLGGLIIAAIAYFFALRKSEKLRYLVARSVLCLPLFGRLVQNYNMTNFCRTLGLLLRSGFNVVESMTVTGNSTPNPVYKQECFQIREHIIKGERISEYLAKKPKLFSDTVSHMIAIGEKSGTLSDSLTYLAEHYEAEVDDTVKNLSSSIEPVLMVFMGIIVGFVAVSIITPIYEVTQHLNQK